LTREMVDRVNIVDRVDKGCGCLFCTWGLKLTS
jgi:hypothetical protein